MRIESRPKKSDNGPLRHEFLATNLAIGTSRLASGLYAHGVISLAANFVVAPRSLALVITMTKQHQYHNDRDHAGNDQVLAEAPATWPRAHGIADDWLLGEGLLWIQVGLVPIGRELVAAAENSNSQDVSGKSGNQ